MQIWNGSDEYCWRYRVDTILSTDGQTFKIHIFAWSIQYTHIYTYIYGKWWPSCGGFNVLIYIYILTHWSHGKMATIFQTTFWNRFSLIKLYELKFHWIFFPRGPFKNISDWVQIMAWRRQAIIWTSDGKFTDAYLCQWPQWVNRYELFSYSPSHSSYDILQQ